MESSLNKGVAIVIMLFVFGMVLLKVQAEGTFELRLEKFINAEGVDETGNCCSSSESTPCSRPCRTAIRVCLKHFQASVNPDPPCTYGSIKTPVIGENSFLPMENHFFRNRPIQFNFTFRWPGTFSLIVDLVAENSDSGNGLRKRASKEVLISRLIKSDQALPVRQGQDTWTTPIPYLHRKSKLYYSYRVLCYENLYGPGCSTYCRPRDDIFGHYTCDENGQKVCLPGWTGNEKSAYCTKAVCSTGCNTKHGNCLEPDFCKCKLGWQGSDCTECITQPGCVHGTCALPFECKCQPGWGGRYCNQDLNYCTNNNPCENGASCSNTGQGSYTCTCKPGFVGNNCQFEVDECLQLHNPCKNGAKCVDLMNDYLCQCPKNFFGRDCERTNVTCRDTPCQHGGECIGGDEHYRCRCLEDWKGVNCEIPVNQCSDKPCQNGGTCQSTSDGFVCFCRSEFSGKFCHNRLSRCSDLPCLNGGKCSTFVPTDMCRCQLCQCAPSFTGARCHGRLEASDYTLSTTQWVAICFGAGVLVLLLVLSAACLIYHRKKVSLSKIPRKFKKNTTERPSTVDLDLPVVTDDATAHVCARMLERNALNIQHVDCCSSTSSRSERSLKNGASWESGLFNPSTVQLSVRNSFTGKERGTRRCSNHLLNVNAMHDFPSNAKQDARARPLSYDLSPQQHGPCRSGVCPAGNRCSDQSIKIQTEHSMSGLPTYEEACEENDSLLRRGLPSHKTLLVV